MMTAERNAVEKDVSEKNVPAKNVVEKNVAEKNVVDLPLEKSAAYMPSERDADVYRLIMIEGVSTRDAARQARVSQTRVRQIVQRVVQWLGETLPAEGAALPAEAALTVARHIAAERLELLYQHALHCWRESTHTKYASLAARLAVARSKLAVITTPSDRLAEAIELPDENRDAAACDEASAGIASLQPLDRKIEDVYEACHPLEEDCSALAAEPSANSYIPFKTLSGDVAERVLCETTFDSLLR